MHYRYWYQENLENAKYAISCGRKIGAPVFALPEDIVEVGIWNDDNEDDDDDEDIDDDEDGDDDDDGDDNDGDDDGEMMMVMTMAVMMLVRWWIML